MEQAIAGPWDEELKCAKSPEIESVGNILSDINDIKYFCCPQSRFYRSNGTIVQANIKDGKSWSERNSKNSKKEETINVFWSK